MIETIYTKWSKLKLSQLHERWAWGGLLSAILLIAVNSQKQPDGDLRARSLQIVDGEGKTRIFLSGETAVTYEVATKDGIEQRETIAATISMMNEEGKVVARLFSRGPVSHLTLHDEDGNRRAQLSGDGSLLSFDMKGEKTVARWP